MVYVLFWTQGKIHEEEAGASEENKIEKMTMTTMKGSLGDAFIKRI